MYVLFINHKNWSVQNLKALAIPTYRSININQYLKCFNYNDGEIRQMTRFTDFCEYFISQATLNGPFWCWEILRKIKLLITKNLKKWRITNYKHHHRSTVSSSTGQGMIPIPCMRRGESYTKTHSLGKRISEAVVVCRIPMKWLMWG